MKITERARERERERRERVRSAGKARGGGGETYLDPERGVLGAELLRERNYLRVRVVLHVVLHTAPWHGKSLSTILRLY